MNKTSIEWVKNPDGSQGYTWNPVTGCLNHVNGLCKGGGFPCYAYKLANRRLSSKYLAGGIVGDEGKDHENLSDPFYPRFWEEKLYHPWGGKRRGIFVCDMSDLFGIGIPEEWTRTILDLCRKHEQNRYYLLTKQPQNLIKWSPFPDNAWVGVTATSREMFDMAVAHLIRVTATVKYISFEPLLTWRNFFFAGRFEQALKSASISWLIIGAQTKPYKPPKIEWVQEIVEAADKTQIPVFLKDNLRPLLIPEDCSKPNYLTEDIFWASEKAKLRQEFPNTKEAHE